MEPSDGIRANIRSSSGSRCSMSNGSSSLELEVLRYRLILGPRLALRLERPDQQFSGIFLPVGSLFADVEDRLGRRQTFNGFRHDVEVFACMKRNRDSMRLCKQVAPHPASNQDLVRRDGAAVCDNTDDPSITDFQALGFGGLEHLRALRPGPLLHCNSHIQRIDLPV